MRVIAITPVHVTEEEFNRRQARYDRISPEGLKVDLVNFSEIEPKELETSLDVLASDLGLIADIHSIKRHDFDFLMPDCVLDPGFRQDGDEFVVGMLESVINNLVNSGHQIGAVTRNEAIGAELVRRIDEYGYSANFVGNEVINLSFDAISNDDLWHESLETAVEKLAAKGASIVINGCSAVNLIEARLVLQVIDPAEMALSLIMDRKKVLETNYGKI
jgi:Asp/Glu/hydantoin racemase